jgi:hypothetical protein
VGKIAQVLRVILADTTGDFAHPTDTVRSHENRGDPFQEAYA